MSSFILATLLLAIVLQCITASLDKSCDSRFTPQCIRQLYHISPGNANQPRNFIAVASLDGASASLSDLAQFVKTYSPESTPSPTYTFVSVNGGKDDAKNPDLFTSLGLQYIAGLAGGVPITYISVGSSDGAGLQDLSQYVLGMDEPPTVLFITSAVDENKISPAMAHSICNSFQSIGARGVSIIVPTGDGGVAGMDESTACEKFLPTFPASCPFVTSVGGTVASSEAAESTARITAGGFSNIFDQPSYQSAAVNRYLSGIGNMNAGLFRSTGRAFPDVAAVCSKLVVLDRGEEKAVETTLGGAAIFASTIALLNGQLIAAGKPTLGFLNPLLYQQAGALEDIVTGSNPGCGTNGFPANLGWDPSTGLGTPNFPRMQQLVGVI